MTKTGAESATNHEEGLNRLQQTAAAAKISELPVADFMSSPQVTIMDGTKIFTAIQTLATHHLTGAPVVDRTGRLVGMVSEYDLLMQAATRDLSEPMSYTKDVITLAPTATLREVIVELYRRKLRRIPIVDKNRRVMGIVSRMDVLKRLITRK